MKQRSVLFKICGIINITLGISMILFAFCGNALSNEFSMIEIFSEAFVAFIALPGVIIAAGVCIVLDMEIGRIFSLFISIISAIYLFAVLFSRNPPVFLSNPDNEVMIAVFQYFLPITGVLYFAFQGIVSYFFQKSDQVLMHPDNE
ncbi:MAG: hypothetical protein JW904_02385 [Spirochaetales bacterium]|nr:hypothetical protein [Spirochaetales bacterium]